jgi:hypothetical protein
VPIREPRPAGGRLVYRPALLGNGRLHFVRSPYKVDHWEDRTTFFGHIEHTKAAVSQEMDDIAMNVLVNHLHADPRPPNNRLSAENSRIGNNPVQHRSASRQVVDHIVHSHGAFWRRDLGEYGVTL